MEFHTVMGLYFVFYNKTSFKIGSEGEFFGGLFITPYYWME